MMHKPGAVEQNVGRGAGDTFDNRRLVHDIQREGCNAVGRIKVLNKTTRPRPAQRGAPLQIRVENRGFEPLTSAVRSQRSTN